MKNDLIYVAKIGKVIGLKGYLKLFIDSDFPEQFKKKNIVFLLEDSSIITIEYYNKNNSTIKIKNIDTPESARAYTNKSIFSTLEDTRKNCKLKENEYFWFELEKCEVYENSTRLGIVKELVKFGDMTYFSILTDENFVEKEYSKEFLIPKDDQYIEKIDIENKKIFAKNGILLLGNS